jgi:adenosylhomocysteine nucleosidase
VERALGWVLDDLRCRPGVILTAGFSGALQPQAQVGDLVLAGEVTDGERHTWPATWPVGDCPPLPRGRLLGRPAVVSSPAEKQRLGRVHNAVAVDMESAAVARVCWERGVPFGCLRVISDSCRTALSAGLADVLRGGQVAPWRLLRALARRPALAADLVRLARDTRRAARELAAGLTTAVGGR